MTRKIYPFLLIIFNLLAIIYLISPTPTLPDLPNSVKSNLPGDTTQISHVTAYYTNMSRTEVMNFYKAYYTGLFRINLNHPPEKAKEIIVNTIPSYYLEEIVLPFKDLFISTVLNGNKMFSLNPKTASKINLSTKIKNITPKSLSVVFLSVFPTASSLFATEISLITIILVLKSFVKK